MGRSLSCTSQDLVKHRLLFVQRKGRFFLAQRLCLLPFILQEKTGLLMTCWRLKYLLKWWLVMLEWKCSQRFMNRNIVWVQGRPCFWHCLHKRFMIRSAIYFLVQFGVFNFLLPLLFQAPLKEDEVEWQAEPKHACCQQSDIDPEWISIQRSHHSQEQRLLKECKQSANERLQASQTTEMWWWVYSSI